MAIMCLASFRDRLIYDKSIATFWLYSDRGVYVPITDEDDISETISSMMVKWNLKGGITTSRIREVLVLIRLMSARINDLDDRWISFLDCMWSPEMDKTEKIDKSRVATIHIPVNFSDIKNSECPKWKKYLSEVCVRDDGTENPKMRIQLQEFAGSLIWPKIENTPCLFLFGEGSNGKSVYINAMRGIVGVDRSSAIGLEKLIGDRFSMAGLVGKRFNSADEMGNCHQASTQRFKAMVFGETVNCERKFGHPFDFNPKCKHCYGLNRTLNLPEVTLAIKRRILIIPFYKTFDPFTDEGRKSTIKHLGEIIVREELPGLVNWAMEGLKMLRENDFWHTQSPESNEMYEKFERESSSIVDFLRENFYRDEGSSMDSADAYSEYVEWCKSVGRKPVSRLSFGRDFGLVFGKSVSRWEAGSCVKRYCAARRIKPMNLGTTVEF